MERYHPVAGIADIIILRPARRAGPSAAQDALPEVSVRKWAVAEITEEPGEARGIPVRGFPLFSDAWNVLPDAGYQILFLLPVLLITG